ncbi:pyridoxamine 5'-phosphate oxidase [Flavobacterium psychrotrophum]|uniref:pyridoxamine 5'-phosphate oxidase n=1 Tax=Flavobacterium psychrotrophum TaxID=2294119 RepID=UPI000E32343C|nr:pyridoxamine 5'-phosphate oxidase [Flavobacterium psychrotrophum]
MSDLSNYRRSYEKSELTETQLPEDPVTLFKKWFIEAEEFGASGEINAMTVSTLGLDGYPNSRVVLLKQYTYEGFIFFTNYNSDKGKAIAANPNVCLSFFWQDMERQVIIKGRAEKTSENTSDGYFESRPTGSRLGAIASEQSSIVSSREYLDDRLVAVEHEYEGREIPRPEHWGGYLVRPVSVEFWQGRPNRMHDRIRFVQQEDHSWKIIRLAP